MKKANKLINQKSPYLLQHAFNPVNWYPWSDEAFSLALSQDKPVFLSIGYSTCHWCHVMERESFEDDEVAVILNDNFICIKVDREERPDIDNIYMNVCQLINGSGGWPLTIFMDGNKIPFYAGTYFSKISAYGKPGLIDLCSQIIALWNNEKGKIAKASGEIINALNSNLRTDSFSLKDEIYTQAFNILEQVYDQKFGGFGTAPKFPSAHNLLFLLRYYYSYNNKEGLVMVENTLTNMRLGGIYDQVGFGFHRYSTDREWFAPHFEKMLYDQALIILPYLELCVITHKNLYKDTVNEIIKYLINTMMDNCGCFYSAQDADSEGIEGKFYVWTKAEIESILSPNDSKFASLLYNVTSTGNWNNPTLNNTGANILFLDKNYEEVGNHLNIDKQTFKFKIDELNTKLYNHRNNRIHPATDDKILTDWNALIISALAKASMMLDKNDCLVAAKKAANFILSTLYNGNILFHRYKDNEAAIPGFLDDYIFLANALIDLYEACFDSYYLLKAKEILDLTIENFWDTKLGGFFFTAVQQNDLIIRKKEIFDGALPSGNSVALQVLLKFYRFSMEDKYLALANNLKDMFSANVRQSPSSYTAFLNSLFLDSKKSYDIIICTSDRENIKEVLRIIYSVYSPFRTIIVKDKSNSNQLDKNFGYLINYKIPAENEFEIYICQNFTCSLPVNNIKDLQKILKDH